MRFSAVDIGSNAVRILFSEVFKNSEGEAVFRKVSLLRLPIRLGEDAFIHGKIKKIRTDKLTKTIAAYKLLNEVYGVIDYRVYATSAMREASNGMDLVELIKSKTGIEIEILKGQKEAEIIYENHIAETLNPRGSYLYVDVGGGSTELSIFKRGLRIESESFDVGTLRLKNKLIIDEAWNKMKEWLTKYAEKHEPLLIIGTGGNINRLYKLAKLKDYAPFYYKQLKEVSGVLRNYTNKQRVEKLGLRPDRADVIVPASEIFLKIMKWSDIKEIMVPKLGLADGVIHQLYTEQLAKIRK